MTNTTTTTTSTTTSTSNHNARLGAGELQRLLQIDGRLFETTAVTPCRINFGAGQDQWFSPFRDRERAAKQCMGCPFRGRCGYNAVATRATHGVWGGQVLPGDFPGLLEPIYERLLQQFEQRRPIELGDAPAPTLPGVDARRRNRAA
ncbi:WhiB family transcriptional regulator [Mycobacterium sp. 29Ha]|uniref:WhiB family transcriptional regulator n=1 Tax=Mycobacterium sp. 29Ha TaxID=2939268 RepID=UPI00293919A9|nr:WhiB family transcriptional regulator [Mycobacterium sp. 29Ha]MDV3133285.1 WhiB family transcriptional regulator [Mycobacterium sp. 29Ha]